jgi:serine phosphatase RsbU (regulator of sigma subunit)
VLAALRRHAGSEPPHDDITLLALRRRAPQPEPGLTA